ncbi:MAG: beta-galactosidase [Anaerolineae bacterium]|nr:beta-galactosidase [Anaerolineae bacterium]
MQSTAVVRQRQIRGFVVAWLGITLLMGALTFIGMYYATGLINNDDGGGDGVNVAALPNTSRDEAEQAAAEDEIDLSDINATVVPTAVAALPEAEAAAAVEAAEPGGDEAPVPAVEDGQGGGPAPLQDATPVPTLTPRPVDVQDFQLGIQVQENPDGEVYRLWMGEVRDKLKLNWIKQQVRWEYVEPQPGQYDWGALDVTFEKAAEYDIKVMVSVVTAPEWAREAGNQSLDKVGPPGDPQTYANFLTAMLQRYPGRIHAVEVWNEMNIDREWASVYGLNPQKYVELLTVAYNTIKAIDPGIIVISGALSPTGVNDGVGAYDDFVYMDMLIAAGMLNVTDCVGAHHNGYNIGPNVPWNNVPNDPTAIFRGPFDNPHHSWSFYSTLNGYAQKIQQAGSNKRLCITEFGWATTEGLGGTPLAFEFADDNTLAEQAAYIDEAITLMDQWGFVWLAWVWNLNYGAQSGWEATNDNVPYSLLRPEWQTAPAYESIGKYNFRGS